jgi:mannose-1-phosphate guanylyltransferase
MDALRAADPRYEADEVGVSFGKLKLPHAAPFEAARSARRWGIVLAGGDGVRLQGLTRLICGDNRPKQFCPLLGECTLLDQTRRRAERSIDPRQILYSVTKAHQDYYARDLAHQRSLTVVQPSNRGTAPAILSTLLRVLEIAPEAVVAILPCDHYYAPEEAFTAALEAAFSAAEKHVGSVVLLGAEPKAPEAEYGWIELGRAMGASRARLHRVERFIEKPSLAHAARLFRTGSLWNTFVMVGRARAFLELGREFVPELVTSLGTSGFFRMRGEVQIEDWVYDRIAPADFSRQVLSPGVMRLAAMKLDGVEWSDLGDPERLICNLAGNSSELPAWAHRWRSESKSAGVPATAAMA